ncbi:hypothetical protein Thiosp_01883 [Thiorhodovibrio litoralis]|nr:hypothetical protein Thiosp_01883 [Thiorhodovibrio litoralis]
MPKRIGQVAWMLKFLVVRPLFPAYFPPISREVNVVRPRFPG